MPEVVIKVGAKKSPDPGKKRWKVITPDNVVYQVNSDLASLFAEGKSYKIYFEHQEFKEFKFKLIVKAPEEVPDVSTGAPQFEAPTYSRPRAAREDEEGVNRRHRLNWIGERLDKLVPLEHTITYEALHPIVRVLEDLYDAISEERRDPKKEEFPAGYKTPPAPRAAAYKPGQAASVDPDMDDDIPFN